MSFVNAILANCAAAGSRPVLYEVRGRALVPHSGFGLCEGVGRVRAFMRKLGVRAGDRVALLAPNSTRWVAADLAIMAEGAISVPLYARQDPQQLAGMMRDCTPTLLLAGDDALAEAIAAAWPEHCKVATYEEAFASAPVADDGIANVEGSPVTIIYTSGTSGEPKGVVLDAANIDYMLQVTVRELGKMTAPGRSEDRVFHYLPFCFAGSRVMLFSQLRRGNALMLSTDLNNLQVELQEASPHYSLNVPALLERIRNGVRTRLQGKGGVLHAIYSRAESAYLARVRGSLGLGDRAVLALAQGLIFPRIKALIGKDLEFLACGSAALSEDTQRWFQMIGIPVYQIYGLTETTAIITIDDTQNVVTGRVGRPIEGCEVKVSGDGELLCKGPNIFRGYWNRPEATSAVLRDGFFCTGDQVEIDAAGNVKIIGRIKEVLVPESGHNVAPAPIEQRLIAEAHGVEQAVVFGHGRPFLTAVVTGSADDVELDRVKNVINAELPHYMRVRKVYRANEPFSIENGLLTANQKIRRKAVEERYRDVIEGLYR